MNESDLLVSKMLAGETECPGFPIRAKKGGANLQAVTENDLGHYLLLGISRLVLEDGSVGDNLASPKRIQNHVKGVSHLSLSSSLHIDEIKLSLFQCKIKKKQKMILFHFRSFLF